MAQPSNPEDQGPPDYLRPYRQAAEVHGAGFESLLWASPHTQAARFDAVRRICDLRGRSVLDVGCGRADFLPYLIERDVRPDEYIGLEAVPELAKAAEKRAKSIGPGGPAASILRADFVRDPVRMFVGADVVVFSGSFNTLDDGPFYDTLRHAYNAAAEALVFNFLSAPYLAGRDYLRWRRADDVLTFVRGLGGSSGGGREVRTLSDYLPGDTTVRADRED